MPDYDFAGYVTRNDVRCSDGVTIKHGAFDANDGTTVPLVYQHNYNDVKNILGNITLHTVDDGVYGEGRFNDTVDGQHMFGVLKHGDITSMSIGARGIRKDEQDNVLHGEIYEVSLVLKGANPGATIEHVIEHSAYGDYASDELAVIYAAEDQDLLHADLEEESNLMANSKVVGEVLESFTPEEEEAYTVYLTEGESSLTEDQIELINNFDEDQVEVVNMIAVQLEEDEDIDDDEEYDDFEDDDEFEDDESDDEFEEADDAEGEDAIEQSGLYKGENILKHNAFENNAQGIQYYAQSIEEASGMLHAAIDGKAPSLAATLKANGVSDIDLKHGLANIDLLFPNTTAQKGIQVHNPMGLNVEKVLGMFSKSPLSRVKNLFADISEEEARARGYIKGNEKFDSIEKVYFRETTPGTVIRRTKIDRDDVVDIQENGIDVVAFLQRVQQAKLQEEIVRAAFMSDGRPLMRDGQRNPDKISEEHIRPILKDDDLFVIKAKSPTYETLVDVAMGIMPAYQGSGSPKLFINPFDLAALKVLKDGNKRYLYGSNADMNNVANNNTIATYFGCDEVIELRFLPRGTMVIGNLSDYVFGASKGGQVATFDQFDIDFNQNKYLIETRLSGAIQTPKSFVVITVETVGDTTAQDGLMKFNTTGVKTHPAFTTNTDTTEKPGAKYASAEAGVEKAPVVPKGAEVGGEKAPATPKG